MPNGKEKNKKNSLQKSDCFYTKHLQVCLFKPLDADQFHRLLSHPMVHSFLGASSFLSRPELIRDFLQQVSRKKDDFRSQAWLLYSVFDKITLQFIGGCGFKMDWENANTEIFYLLFPEFWGKGLAVEACIPILDNLFKQLGIKNVNALIDPENKRAQRVAAKLGFKPIKTIQLNRYDQKIEAQHWNLELFLSDTPKSI